MFNAKSGKVIVLLLFLFSFANPVSARKVFGYIITNNNDTIKGYIHISKFDMLNKAFTINSYNLDIFYNQIYFKTLRREKGYSPLCPTDIQEYGFFYKHYSYRFISREVETILSNKNKRYFYLQIDDGTIKLFKSKINQNNIGNNAPYGLSLTDIYVLSTENKLIKVSKINNSESLSDFLYRTTNADKAILEKVAANKSFNDIIEVVELYNHYFEEKISI